MKNIQSLRFLTALLAVAILVATGCKKEDPFSEDYDINWPLPTITAINPSTADIDTEITIEGTNLESTTTVKIGDNNLSATIVEKTATALKVIVPRRTVTGPVTIETSYKRSVTSEEAFIATYPNTAIVEWPVEITRTQTFEIKGTNMDLITEVSINNQKVAIDNNSMDKVVVPTEGLDLSAETATIVVTALGDVDNGTSPAIPIIDFDPAAGFEAVPPIVIWDFEDGANPFTTGDITPTNEVRSTAPLGRGANYLHISESNVPDPWGTSIGRLTANNIDMDGFHEPHLTFMINTNGNQGYFQLEVVQNGNKDGGHFTGSSSSNSNDNYMFQTTGWEWRSIPLADFGWEDWGGDGFIDWDKDGIIETLIMEFKQGNGSNPFEINVDHVMITDGAQTPVQALFTFEDGTDPYSGSFTSALNGGSVAPFAGDNVLNVSAATTGSWNWSGQIEYNAAPLDLSLLSKPYLNIAVNTGNGKGYFQVELFQNDKKWGIGQTSPDYLFETAGGWTVVSFDLTNLQLFSDWGGSGSATEFDPSGVLDYVKIGFTSGNIDGEAYNINVDDLYISEGPMF